MKVSIRFIGSLRMASGRKKLQMEVEESTLLGDLLTKIAVSNRKLKQALTGNEKGNSRQNTLVLINGKEINVLNGLETILENGDEIVFIPVVHGG